MEEISKQTDSLIGKTLGQYNIIQEIGRGGMATVYKAWDATRQRYVALKVLPSYFQHDTRFLKRFHREAEAAAKLDHPNIVKIYETGEVDGINYIAMEYVDGGSLQDRLAAGRPLELNTTVSILNQVSAALGYAHGQGIVHRDIKPSNILLTKDGLAVLTDFGIAKASEHSRITRTGALIGTPEYMSPEQARGEGVDYRTDIYSLGVVAYEMLTGRAPFAGDTPHAVLYQHVHEPPPPLRSLNPGLPATMEQVIARVLAKDPRVRYQRAGELARALAKASRGEAVVEEAPTIARVPAVPPIPRERRDFSVAALLGGLAIVLLIVGVMMFGLRGGAPPMPTPASTVAQAMSILTATPRPPTATPSLPTPTLIPPTPSPACMDDATFVSDVTVPDGTSFSPGETINKVWRIKNSGTCAWGAGYELAFVSGEQMGAPTAQAVSSTAPGGTADIGVTMYAPSAAGSYTGTWRMRSPTGIFFGQSVTIVIRVMGAGTPVPPTPTTASPTTTPTAPPPGAEIDFRVDDDSITAGDCTTLRWDVENATAVYLDGTGVTGHGHQDVCPDITTTYTLRVEHAGGPTEETVTVVVAVVGTLTPTPAPTRTVSPTESRYPKMDDFDEAPLSSEWNWVDPLGDSSYSLTANPGHLRLYTPDGGHDLYFNLDAPRMLKPISGDFVATTKVTMYPSYNYQGAGLLIWQDESNYVRLERTLVDGVDMWYRIEGVYKGIQIPYSNPTVYLRVRRLGNKFTAWYSKNGSDWIKVTTIGYPATNTLQVGLSLVNQWQDNPLWADFDYFELD